MNAATLARKLQQHHRQFVATIEALNDDELVFAAANKWSALQQLDHIIKSVNPVRLAFSLPRFILNMLFGKANRPSRTYEELVDKYKAKLASGGRATGRFVPKVVSAADKKILIKKLETTVSALCRKTERCSEAALDQYILPHPLLGKLTLREMLYFTIYHVEHHNQLVQIGLSK